MRGLVVQALARAMINHSHDRGKILIGDQIEVSTLWEVAAQEFIGDLPGKLRPSASSPQQA